MEALKTLEVVLESRKLEGDKFLSGLPNSKVKGPLIKVPNAWDICRAKGM